VTQPNLRRRLVGMSLILMAMAPGRVGVCQRSSHVGRRESSRLEPARGMLRTLIGTWRFEMWFAGNFDGAPDVSGTRLVTTMFDDPRLLQWTEELDHSEIKTRGIIGVDAHSGRFFSSAVSGVGSGPEFMMGTLDDTEPVLTFRPIADSVDQSFSLTLLDADHFRAAALDHSWRAVFTRRP
jgi:hypothetical protein